MDEETRKVMERIGAVQTNNHYGDHWRGGIYLSPSADCEAGNAAVAAAMCRPAAAAQAGHKAAWARARSDPNFTDYWPTAFEVAGVPALERTAELQAGRRGLCCRW